MLWVGSIHDAETGVNLAIVPPQQTQPGQLAVRGQVTAIYRGSRDELQVDQFRLNTPASEINASGSLSASSSLKVTATSHDLKEWRPLLQAAYGAGHSALHHSRMGELQRCSNGTALFHAGEWRS